MKIAIAHDFLLKLGGAERVTFELSKIFPEATIFTLLYDEKIVGHKFPRERVIASSISNSPSILKKRYKFFTNQFPRLIEEFDFSNYDLVISSSSAFMHGIIVPLETLHLCYCHSPMRYAWDWSNEYFEENEISGFKKIIYRNLVKYLREWDYLAADRPDMYLANSNNVKKRIKKYFRQNSEIVYPPVDTERFRAKGKNEDFFLIVSTLSPYKKIDLAVQMFNKIGRRLVIIGDGAQREYLEMIAGENIDFLGFKNDNVVKDYLESCRALIFPGEEDFGISAVEAMACGKPVLAFGKGGCTETVISGKTGEFFFEQTVESMEDGLARLMYNEKFYRPMTIRRHALQFSKENFEKKIQQMIRKLKRNRKN